MRIYFEAFGCSLNRGESQEMVDGALALGHSTVNVSGSADVIVLDTCVVIQATENRMLARLRELGRLERPVIVAGCLPAVAPGKVLACCPRAILIPPDRRDMFGSVLSGLEKSWSGSPAAGKRLMREPGVVEEVPIASGCRGSCTYCIARSARGELRSRSAGEILARVKLLVGGGCREIRLTAQDSALFGLDREDGAGICDLTGSVCALEGEFRVRLGMMNPDTMKPVFEGLMSAYENPRTFRFLHVPVQSSDDAVLEKMGRRYGASVFLELATMFRERFPLGILATDIIVGFPTEGEAQFERTLGLLRQTRPDMVNVKAFSPRPGTLAAGLPRRPAREVVRARIKKLNDLRHRISLDNNRRLEGTTARVLVTEKAKGGVLARTADYRPVLVQGPIPLGVFREVRMLEARPGYLTGSPI
jgi:MiaB-like tRNA modifying enzyme